MCIVQGSEMIDELQEIENKISEINSELNGIYRIPIDKIKLASVHASILFKNLTRVAITLHVGVGELIPSLNKLKIYS